jgi:hypothetical protein
MKKSLRDAFRQIELDQGDASEKYFDDIMRRSNGQGKLPPWLLDWEHCEKWSDADRAGIDFFIKTDKGNIKINIKSSRIFAKQFQSKPGHEDIIPVVVNILERPETFLGRFISIISKIYRSM